MTRPALLFTLICVLATLSACGPLTFTVGLRPTDEDIESTVVERDPAGWTSNRVAIIDITGLIHNSRSSSLLAEGKNPVDVLHQKLEAARNDSDVKAILLRINSPGGTVTATDAMYREIERFRADTGKPVVTVMMDVAASGGYYVSCATDHVVAYPTTITASIGVILQTISVRDGLERIGIRPEAITSGPHKDTGSPLGRLDESDREILRTMVDDFYQRFRGVVREARPNIDEETFATATDGRIVTGEAAFEMGLVDQLGDLHDAWAVAKKLADVERAHLALYHTSYQPAKSPYAQTPTAGRQPVQTQINLAQFNFDELLVGDPTSSFLYLWRPNLD